MTNLDNSCEDVHVLCQLARQCNVDEVVSVKGFLLLGQELFTVFIFPECHDHIQVFEAGAIEGGDMRRG